MNSRLKCVIFIGVGMVCLLFLMSWILNTESPRQLLPEYHFVNSRRPIASKEPPEDSNTSHSGYISPNAEYHFVSVKTPTAKKNPSEDNDTSPSHYISPNAAYRRFFDLTLPSCKNVCDRNRSPTCNVTSNGGWDKILKVGNVTGVPLYQENEYMFSFEKFYQKFAPLKDMKKLPDQEQSVIYHVDTRGVARIESQVTCNHMQKLTFRADLKDSYGNQRTHGGDTIRAWIKGNPSNESAYDFSSAGKVEDLNNGSYLATVTCAWAGYATLNVGIAYPREYIRVALDNSRRGVYVLITGTFSRDGIDEETICQNHPNIPGRPCLCNLTDLNQSPFFCGKPLDKRLSCKDIAFTQSIDNQARLVYTAAEKKLSTSMTRQASRSTIHQEIKIRIINEDPSKLPQKPCYELRKQMSWDFQYSRGFWSSDGQWSSFLCKQPALESNWVTNCLQDTSIWLIGDSNTIITYRTLRELTGSRGGTPSFSGYGVSRNKERNINITFTGHGHTIHSGDKRRMPRRPGVSRFVDTIPSTGKHYVLFNYYLHLSRSHFSAFYMRLIELRQTILRLLKRIPKVNVMVRGPHICTVEVYRNHMLGGDTLAVHILALWRKVFHDMKDKVLFLDGWDMSVAMENHKYHPNIKLTKQLIRTIVSYHCKQ